MPYDEVVRSFPKTSALYSKYCLVCVESRGIDAKVLLLCEVQCCILYFVLLSCFHKGIGFFLKTCMLGI